MKTLEVEDIIKNNLDKKCECSCKGKQGKRTLLERVNDYDFYYTQNVLVRFDIKYSKRNGYAEYGGHYLEDAEDGGELVCNSCRDSIKIDLGEDEEDEEEEDDYEEE